MDSNKLIFEQVAEIVENQILDGYLKADDQSPSTTEFANVYGNVCNSRCKKNYYK